MECDACKGTGSRINTDKTVSRCLCVRREYIAKMLNKRIAGEVLFKNPSDLLRFADVAFINMDLKHFKDYLAGYLLYKQTDAFQLMNVSEYFTYRMDNSDNAELLKPDLLVLNFSGIFFNKAAPIFIMQICDERLALNKKTWLVSGLSRHDLEIGFKESKDIFNDFINRIDLRMFNPKKKKFNASKNVFSSSLSANENLTPSWKNSI